MFFVHHLPNQSNQSWDPPLALACALNRVKGWREVWGVPRGRWHRDYVPAEWIRLSWPSDDADFQLLKEDRERLRQRYGGSGKPLLYKPQWDEPPLIKYVDTWLVSHGNWKRWRRENPQLASILDKTFSAYPHLAQLPGGQITVECFHVVPAIPGHSVSAATFGRFLLSPGRGFPGKCLRCGRYFLNFGKYERKYCEHRCAAHDSAIRHIRESRRQAHLEHLAAARKAVSEIARRPTVPNNWKEIVAAKVGVRRNWVTGAIHRDELRIGKRFPESSTEVRKTRRKP